MNISSLNSTRGIHYTNPLGKRNKNKSNPNFSGCILTQDSKGRNIYKFFSPNAPAGTTVEVAVMTKDINNEYKVHEKPETHNMPEGFNPLILTEKELGLDKNSVLGYKIHIPGKVDMENCVTGDKGFHIAPSPSDANLSLPKVIQHVYIDSFNVKDPELLKTKRNHFNILGGNINSVKEKIPELYNAGFTDILGNPLFGQDNKSGQGYWTTNTYQITKNLGSIRDFKDLMIELYKKQMRWTADGAFVNEGLEGIHIMDILNNGIKSPFLSMFETKDVDNLTIKLGVLSKSKNVNKHLHIQLMNAPYKITFAKDGDRYIEKSVKRVPYDSTKETYIQIFDDRLASEQQMNGNEIFDVYDKKSTGDEFEITNYMASAQTYHKSVTPREVEKNYQKYKEAKHYDKDIEFKNSLLRWTNFEIVNSNKDGGISLWVGNSDIAKKRFIAPELTMKPEKEPFARIAQYQVQDDTVQIGKFWTNEVTRTLTEYTARELAKEVKSGKTYKEAIDSLVNSEKLPQGAKTIYEKDENGKSPLDNILKKSAVNADKRYYSLKPVKMPESVVDGLMSYPFEAIEFSPDLVGIFAYPHIKNLATTEDMVGKTRYEMYKMGDEYYNKLPEEYKTLYKETDNFISTEMKSHADNILKKLEKKTNIKIFDEKQNLTQQGKEIYSLIAADITKFLVVSSLAPQISIENNDTQLEYNIDELRKISLNSLNLQYEVTPKDTAAQLLYKLKDGLRKVDEKKEDNLVEHLEKRLKDIDSDAINVAKLIIEKTESGLNWRIDASKDVGAAEDVDDAKFSHEKNIDEIEKFWNKFNTGTSEYNPHRHSTGELTNVSSNLFASFMSKSKFTTISDYEYFYSVIRQLYGGVDDSWNGNSNINGLLQEKLFSHVDTNNNTHIGYFDSGIEESLNYAHRFLGNHDKPRILHQLALDAGKFKTDKSGAMADTIKRGFEGSNEFRNLQNEYKSAIYQAVNLLEEGKYYKDGEINEFIAEKFGIRPFDFNIDAVIEQAKNINTDFKKYTEENEDVINKIKAETLQTILKPAMEKYRAMWFAINVLPGAPTNFAGDELGMTGWETASKNENQENRNALRWDRLEDKNYAFIKDFKERIDAITRIRRKEAASALNNGSTIKFTDQVIHGQRNAVALYRYNDKTDAICILHNNGYSSKVHDCGHDSYINHINLTGLPNGLPVGTIYKDALNPNNKFKVTDKYKIEKLDGGSINLGNCGLILLRDKDFKGRVMSFSGRIENANVKLANTKYNVSTPNYAKV